MNSDGSNKINLTKNKAWDFFPAWSRKRNKIAFTSERSGNKDIFIINKDGSGLINLTKNKADDLSPAFSPDGSYITFVSNRDGIMSIYRMNSDGSNIKRLTFKGERAGPAIFSPDGKTLILKRRFTNPGRFEFFLSDINGKNVRKMDPLKEGHEDPYFSKDGRAIIFSAFDTDTKTWQIFSVDTKTGKELKRLTSDPKGYFAGPSFSPDEKRIIYRRMERYGDDWSLWLMDADGKNQKRLTGKSIKANFGIFSPGGSKILASMTLSANNWQIYIMNADGITKKKLTNNNQWNLWPRWFEAKNIP